jgi:hypothetical protein
MSGGMHAVARYEVNRMTGTPSIEVITSTDVHGVPVGQPKRSAT